MRNSFFKFANWMSPCKSLTKSMESEKYWVKVRACRACQGQLLYARFHNPSYRRYWEIYCDRS